MTQIRILVVEDNPIVRQDIVESLDELGYEVSGTADSGEAAILSYEGSKPDLVLMDINLKGKMDGIEVATKLSTERPVPIIYLTAYSDSTTIDRAKKTFPFAYMVKPFDEKDLGIAIDLAIYNFAHTTHETDVDRTHSQYVVRDAIYIKVDKRFLKIPTDSVTYVSAAGSYCEVCTTTKRYTLSMNLHSFQKRIQHPDFLRVSRSMVVNLRKVDSFEVHRLFIGKEEIRIGESYREDFQKRFLSI